MEADIYNNSDFYEDLDKNFEMACSMCEYNYSHIELIELLKNGNIPQKQIAALKLDCINNGEEANVLLSCLTGCDGKIREATALKINKLLRENPELRYIFAQMSSDKFADASLDINANICRVVIDTSVILSEYKEFSQTYTNKIVDYAKQALTELDKFIFRDKKYVINKQLFKLYWCLEALSNFYIFADEESLRYIVQKSSEQNEYTVREKTAQLLVKAKKYKDISDKLKNDENYYVREIFKSS